MMKSFTILTNTTSDLKTIFAKNDMISDIAAKLFTHLYKENANNSYWRREGEKMNIFFPENTKKGIPPIKLIFSLDTNGQILVEQSHKHPENGEQFFQYHLSHKNVDGNNVYDIQNTAPLPEILNDDEAVKQAFRDTYSSHEKIKNLSIERPENQNGILIYGKYE